MRRFASLIAALTIAGWALVSQAQNVDTEPLPLVPSRQTAFRIPFTIDTPGANSPVAAEVQLHVSADRGGTWQLAGRVPPEARAFQFQAPKDGEYWFLVRTKDATGRLRPDGPPAPQMRVLVDTRPPQLEVVAQRTPRGEVRILVRAIDAHLNPNSLQLAYPAAGNQWRQVAIDPLARDPATLPGQPEMFVGETIVFAEDLQQVSLIRAEISDLVGNPTTVQAMIAPASSEPTTMPPAASVATGPETLPAPGSSTLRPASSPTPSTIPPSSSTPVVETIPPPMSPPTPGVPPPQMPATFSETPLGRPPVGPPPPLTAPTKPPEQLPTGQAAPPESLPAGALTREESLPFPGTVTREEPLPPPTEQPPRSLLAPVSTPAKRYSTPLDVLPEGVEPRAVASRRFELDYDVAQIGVEEVARVELWLTRDGGRTWVKRGEDDDRRSPYRVEVDEDGLYGYRLVIESILGMRSPTPVSGDLADVWVWVDTQPPAVRLEPFEPSALATSGLLTIRWQAADARLATHPVTLSFSETHDGPWSTIAAGLPNSGRYDWKLDPRLPSRVFLRIEVVDEAEHRGTAVTTEPIPLELVRPQSRILGVRPVAPQPAPSVEPPTGTSGTD